MRSSTWNVDTLPKKQNRWCLYQIIRFHLISISSFSHYEIQTTWKNKPIEALCWCVISQIVRWFIQYKITSRPASINWFVKLIFFFALALYLFLRQPAVCSRWRCFANSSQTHTHAYNRRLWLNKVIFLVYLFFFSLVFFSRQRNHGASWSMSICLY